jgi:AcrR family transcriptional regulator
MALDLRDRILDAAVETAAVHGLARLSLSDVARRAGISRPTLYRHFATRDELVAQAVRREASVLIDRVVEVVDAAPDGRAALVAVVEATLRFTREHPVLDRIVHTEPETLVPLLVGGWHPEAPGVVADVRSAIEAFVGGRYDVDDPVARRRFADVLARLLVSYAVNPPDDPPEVVAEGLATVLGGIGSV